MRSLAACGESAAVLWERLIVANMQCSSAALPELSPVALSRNDMPSADCRHLLCGAETADLFLPHFGVLGNVDDCLRAVVRIVGIGKG